MLTNGNHDFPSTFDWSDINLDIPVSCVISFVVHLVASGRCVLVSQLFFKILYSFFMPQTRCFTKKVVVDSLSIVKRGLGAWCWLAWDPTIREGGVRVETWLGSYLNNLYEQKLPWTTTYRIWRSFGAWWCFPRHISQLQLKNLAQWPSYLRKILSKSLAGMRMLVQRQTWLYLFLGSTSVLGHIHSTHGVVVGLWSNCGTNRRPTTPYHLTDLSRDPVAWGTR